MSARPPVRGTAAVLLVGTLASIALFVTGVALAAARLDGPARLAGDGGVVLLLLTPALGLAATVVELRALQPRVAILAVIVLAVLGGATAIALLARA